LACDPVSFSRGVDVRRDLGDLRRTTEGREAMREFWVFGYGSLMWRPGFAHEQCIPARLSGFHRALCVFSHVHRGTPERPGLVLGLDRGGACRGVAFRAPAHAAEATLAYLRERELVTNVYREVVHRVTLLDGSQRAVDAVCYVVDRSHPQYAGKRAPEELLALVQQGLGKSGTNRDYVVATQEHLDQMGIRDPVLDWLAHRLRAVQPAGV
jgi:cation transport protein ChaC